MFYFYILESQQNKSYYVGSCSNIKNRLKHHNSELVRSTKRYLPWKLIYTEQFNNLRDARRRELQVKSWKKRNAIEKLIKHSKI